MKFNKPFMRFNEPLIAVFLAGNVFLLLAFAASVIAKTTARLQSSNFPETLAVCFVINATFGLCLAKASCEIATDKTRSAREKYAIRNILCFVITVGISVFCSHSRKPYTFETCV